MLPIENWIGLVGSISFSVWFFFGIPLHLCLIFATILGILISTLILTQKFWTSKKIKDRIQNVTEDDIALPDDFLFGAATAAYQVEGENYNNDWYHWEQKRNFVPCGIACDVWNLFEHDVQRMKWLGLNSFRFSVEWSRIQPTLESWDESALQRYFNWCSLLRKNKIEPIVTLHHFTSPMFLKENGGFANEAMRKNFAVFCQRVTEKLRPHVTYFVTFNEPTLYALNSCVTNDR